MKRIVLIATLIFGCLLLHVNSIKAQEDKPSALADWTIVTTGNEMSNLIKQAPVGQTLNIKAAGDLTLGNITTIPADVTLTIDMDNHALYTTGDSRYFLSSGDKVTFQNEQIVSTAIRNDGITVPKPAGGGTVSGRYNSYYGLFSTTGNSYQVKPTLTFKNVTQDFGTITIWGSAGQPFYNYGIQVHFSGDNYFNYGNTGQEFMEGAGFNVLDGKTQILGGNTNGYSFVQQTLGGALGKGPAGIDIAAGADLEINWQSTGAVNGIWALNVGGGAKATSFHINNQGTLNWNSTMHKPPFFFGNTKTDIPITYTFGPKSKTMINVPGLFNYSVTSGAFKSSVGKNADFIYNSSNNYPIFVGANGNIAQFNINSATRISFITTRSELVTSSVLGNSVVVNLNNDDMMEGYDVYGYTAFGDPTLVPSLTKGAFGVSGSFHGDLSDMGGLTGLHLPNASDIVTYQKAAQLEFNKQSKKILSFKTIPSDNAMMFKYELNSDLVNNVLPRNDGDLNMSFDIVNTLSDDFSVQANITNNGFANGMSFAWKDGSSTMDLDAINNTIFTSTSTNMKNDGDGNYQINYLADEGLLFKSTSSKYNLGAYSAQVNWTLINGIS